MLEGLLGHYLSQPSAKPRRDKSPVGKAISSSSGLASLETDCRSARASRSVRFDAPNFTFTGNLRSSVVQTKFFFMRHSGLELAVVACGTRSHSCRRAGIDNGFRCWPEL